jgi:hypothetical protein
LFTSDELPHYETALVEHFSHLETQPKTGNQGLPKKQRVVIDPELLYTTVHKTRDNGKMVKVNRTVIFGNPKRIDHAIEASNVRNRINISFIERTNLTLRNHNRKLTRKTLCFAKIKQSLEAQTTIVVTYYNFSTPHRGLTLISSMGKKIKRTPAIAANIIDHIWPMGEILAYPIVNNN